MPSNGVRWLLGIFAVLALLAIFVFQRFDFASLLGFSGPKITSFIVNRSIRFLLNDFFAILLIYALFNERKFVVFSIWVQLAGTLLFLVPYFILKIQYPDYNGPLINFLHRLILNPTLLLLLIPAFYFQTTSHQHR